MSALEMPEPKPRRWQPDAPERALVLIDAEFLMDMAQEANPGATFTVEWGTARVEEITYYEPTITRHEVP